MRRIRPLTIYYLATPVFALLDYGFGLSFRIRFLDPYPPGKAVYYLACVTLGLLYLRWGKGWASLLGLLECAGNALLLALSVMMPIFGLMDALEVGVEIGQPFTPLFLINLVMAQAVVLYAFYTNPIIRRSPPLPGSR